MSDVTSHTEVQMGSEKSFGLVFAAVFSIVALWPIVFGSGSIRIWAIVIAGLFVGAAFLFPQLLRPMNRLWFKFGALLAAIVTPITMGIIFVLTVIPIGYLRRIRNSDPLKQKFDPDAETYWVERSKDTAPTSMTKQF